MFLTTQNKCCIYFEAVSAGKTVLQQSEVVATENEPGNLRLAVHLSKTLEVSYGELLSGAAYWHNYVNGYLVTYGTLM